MVQPGRQAHVLRTDVGALQVQISDLRLQTLGLHPFANIVAEKVGCLTCCPACF